MPAAAGLTNFVRITAGAVGTSIFTTLWENRAALHHAHLAEPISTGQRHGGADAGQLCAAGYSREQALAQMNRMIDQQAYTMAATDLFYLSSVLFVVLIALVWFSAPSKAVAGALEGGAH